jgi:hypothetical protein
MRGDDMKKIFGLLLVLGVLFAVQAAVPTYAAVDGVYEWAVDTTIVPGDTLEADADSTILLSNYTVEQGWQYILYRGAFTGDGSDSVKVRVEVYNENSAGTRFYATNVDSFTASAGEAIDLSVGGLNFGSRIDVRLYSYSDNGGEVVNPTYYLVKRRPYIWERRK